MSPASTVNGARNPDIAKGVTDGLSDGIATDGREERGGRTA